MLITVFSTFLTVFINRGRRKRITKNRLGKTRDGILKNTTTSTTKKVIGMKKREMPKTVKRLHYED